MKKYRSWHGAHWNAEGRAPCVSVRNSVLNRYERTGIMTLEERISHVRDDFPDPMTQTQLCEALGLGRSSVYRLIRRGVIPYEDRRDQLSHYHMIQQKDVIRYLKRRYAHASERYMEAGKRCIAILLRDEPEILAMKDVIRITGIWKSAVQKWIRAGKLRGFAYIHSTIVRKSDLIGFMASPSYQDSSHRNIRTEAVILAVEWYLRVSECYEKGGRVYHG